MQQIGSEIHHYTKKVFGQYHILGQEGVPPTKCEKRTLSENLIKLAGNSAR
jgi:hypothetical protein